MAQQPCFESPLASMPELRGRTATEARRELEKLDGIKIAELAVVSSESKGTVVGQTPGAGSDLVRGRTISLRISSGPPRPAHQVMAAPEPPPPGSQSWARSALFLLLQSLAALLALIAWRGGKAAAPATAAKGSPARTSTPSPPAPSILTSPGGAEKDSPRGKTGSRFRASDFDPDKKKGSPG